MSLRKKIKFRYSSKIIEKINTDTSNFHTFPIIHINGLSHSIMTKPGPTPEGRKNWTSNTSGAFCRQQTSTPSVWMQGWYSKPQNDTGLLTTHLQTPFLSDPFKLRLNHFFLEDLSFPSELPSSPGLSALNSSPGALLLLPLLTLELFPLLWITDLVTVNVECMLSRCFSSSSTCFYKW